MKREFHKMVIKTLPIDGVSRLELKREEMPAFSVAKVGRALKREEMPAFSVAKVGRALMREEMPVFTVTGVRRKEKYDEKIREVRLKGIMYSNVKATQRYYKSILSQEGKDIDKTISFLNSIIIH